MKRIFDLMLLICLSPVVIPIIGLVAVFSLITIGKPVFFVQERIGYKNKSFKLIKFRTMKTGLTDNLDEDALRLNWYGNFLRSTSIDELPSLYNILIGDMSFVGPRPLLTKYLGLYTDRQIQRHTVLPGLTGWSQINGRNQISWEKRFELDLWYVDNRSLLVDIKIMFLTALYVLSRKNINHSKNVTMPEFRGSKKATEVISNEKRG